MSPIRIVLPVWFLASNKCTNHTRQCVASHLNTRVRSTHVHASHLHSLLTHTVVHLYDPHHQYTCIVDSHHRARVGSTPSCSCTTHTFVLFTFHIIIHVYDSHRRPSRNIIHVYDHCRLCTCFIFVIVHVGACFQCPSLHVFTDDAFVTYCFRIVLRFCSRLYMLDTGMKMRWKFQQMQQGCKILFVFKTPRELATCECKITVSCGYPAWSTLSRAPYSLCLHSAPIVHVPSTLLPICACTRWYMFYIYMYDNVLFRPSAFILCRTRPCGSHANDICTSNRFFDIASNSIRDFCIFRILTARACCSMVHRTTVAGSPGTRNILEIFFHIRCKDQCCKRRTSCLLESCTSRM